MGIEVALRILEKSQSMRRILIPFLLFASIFSTISAQSIVWRRGYSGFHAHKVLKVHSDRYFLSGQWEGGGFGAMLVNAAGDSLATYSASNSVISVQTTGLTRDTLGNYLVGYFETPGNTHFIALDSSLNLLSDTITMACYGLNTRQDGTVDFINLELHPTLYAGHIISIWPVQQGFRLVAPRDSVWTIGFFGTDWDDRGTDYLFGGSSYSSPNDVIALTSVVDTNFSGATYGDGTLTQLEPNPNGGYAAVGYADNSGTMNTFVLFDASLNLIRRQDFSDTAGTNWGRLSNLTATEYGTFLLLAQSGNYVLSTQLLEIDTLGSIVRYFPLGDFMRPPGMGLHYEDDGEIYISGVAADSTTSFLKIDLFGVGIENPEFSGEMNVFPNPSIGKYRVGIPPEWKNGRLEVHDLLGRRLQTINSPANGAEIDLSGEPAGMYIFSFVSDGKQVSVRVVKE